LTVETDEERVA